MPGPAWHAAPVPTKLPTFQIRRPAGDVLLERRLRDGGGGGAEAARGGAVGAGAGAGPAQPALPAEGARDGVGRAAPRDPAADKPVLG